MASFTIDPDIVEKIRQRVEEEKINPPIPREYSDVPVSYELITREWLTVVIARGHENTILKSFALGPRDDGSFNRRRLHSFVWEGPDADKLPKSVFCKAGQGFENRLMLSNGGIYSEVAFYKLIRPLIDIEAPHSLYAEYDTKSWASMIMLSDMSDSATFANYQTVLSKEQFAEQFKLLAKLHGRFYETKEEFFPRLVKYKTRFENLVRSLDIESVCGNGFDRAKTVIPPPMFARKAEVWPATVKSVYHNASLPQTAVHGDVHLGNWYIKRNGHMGLTDWSALSSGHWSRDVVYVLSTAVTAERRRLWENEMVQLYLKELALAGGPVISEEQAWLELRRQSFGALWYWTFTLAPSEIMPDMQSEETTMEFISRISSFMHDHDALDSFTGS